MMIPSLIPSYGQPLQQGAPRPSAEAPQTTAEPTDRVNFHVDPTAPHKRLIIPHDGQPLNLHPVSGSRTARFIVSGTIVGGMSGGYMALGLLSAYPAAAMGVALGSAIVGGVAGYLASRGK